SGGGEGVGVQQRGARAPPAERGEAEEYDEESPAPGAGNRPGGGRLRRGCEDRKPAAGAGAAADVRRGSRDRGRRHEKRGAVGAREIPEAVRKALDDVVQLKSALADATRQTEERRKRLAELTNEQSRIRENMKTLASNSEYYSRLVKKLDEQETTIETLQKEL